ncbi:MAG: hypothetical protein KME15_25670 [Drouetiella hepatica Uher 2000/2452]|jgi:heme/copper-type cytochrome/quinol oxidase subunit 4|uniref:DUF2029 domain-containing protein n=1 Tax=Drouetiella hepatica Uher 2000/2452 TaxID=904376 RepID=A0A951UPK5_9CYAN|nr:hypothetical protein [Drouetiella hepatica Uher 2000/2452]
MSRKKIAVVCLLAIIAAAIILHIELWAYNTEGRKDIYYLWQDSRRLLAGENPYARILSGNLAENKKYPTYFPVFCLLSYLTHLLGLRDYPSWIYFWRYIFLIFNLGIGSLLFYIFYRQQRFVLAVFSACFWLFGRWTMYVTRVSQIDFIPIFFLLLSLFLLRRHKWTALLLFSLSLGVKQIAVFLVPIYLIWMWRSAEQDRAKTVLLAAAVIISIPLITSLPFLVWNAESFIKSILFSAVREGDDSFGSPSLFKDTVGLRLLPMLILTTLICVGVIRRQVGIYTSALLTLSVFVNFNAVLFTQYFCWIVPFVPLAVSDFLDRNSQDLPKPL